MVKEAEEEFWDLFHDAYKVPIKGWDFSYVKDRMISEPLPWEYRKIILPFVKKSTCLLDT